MIKVIIIAISIYFVYRGLQIGSIVADEDWQNEVASELKETAVEVFEKGRKNVYLSGSQTDIDTFNELDIDKLATNVVEYAVEKEVQTAKFIGGLHLMAGIGLLLGVIIFM